MEIFLESELQLSPSIYLSSNDLSLAIHRLGLTESRYEDEACEYFKLGSWILQITHNWWSEPR